MQESRHKSPTLLDALIPVATLILFLFLSVKLYKDDSSYGANQIALLMAGAIATIIGLKNGYRWKEIEDGIVHGISRAMAAILILLAVGMLIGSWILSGTVPTLVYYGAQILSPSFFYAAACIICAVVSISIGSSWTTAGTIGVALIGIAISMDLSLPITAGAIISGAYFGDKMSPLSDTTNLAPAIAGTDLFTHIQHMIWTTGPSIIIALIGFLVLGFVDTPNGNSEGLEAILNLLQTEFNLSVWTLIPLLLVFVLAFKKVPALPTIFIGAFVGGIFAMMFQQDAVLKSVSDNRFFCEVVEPVALENSDCKVTEVKQGENEVTAVFAINDQNYPVILDRKGDGDEIAEIKIEQRQYEVEFTSRSKIISNIDAVWRVMFNGYSPSTGDAEVDDLLERGGMSNMLNTVWLILCAMSFGAVLEKTQMLQRLVASALNLVTGTGSLIVTIVFTCIGSNIIASDQYMSIVLPGRMFRAEFRRRKLDPKNLSRVLEDSGTITSPLVPWNTCGVYMSGTLGVATLAYLPFCFFNLVNPLVSILYGTINFKIEKLDPANESLEESRAET